MKKIVFESKTRIVNDDNTEDFVLCNKFSQDIAQGVSLVEDEIKPNSTYTVPSLNNSGKGYKGIRIISDIPLKFSFTSQASTSELAVYLTDITLLGGKDPKIDEYATDTQACIAYNGQITLNNRDTEKTAKIKLVFFF